MAGATSDRAYIEKLIEDSIICALVVAQPVIPTARKLRDRWAGRFSDDSAAFQAQNGGRQDVWGIHKGRAPRVYASDRNGRLYVLDLGR